MPKTNGNASTMIKTQMTSMKMMPPGGGAVAQPRLPSSIVIQTQLVPPATILLGVARHSFFFVYASQRPSEGKKIPVMHKTHAAGERKARRHRLVGS